MNTAVAEFYFEDSVLVVSPGAVLPPRLDQLANVDEYDEMVSVLRAALETTRSAPDAYPHWITVTGATSNRRSALARAAGRVIADTTVALLPTPPIHDISSVLDSSARVLILAEAHRMEPTAVRQLIEHCSSNRVDLILFTEPGKDWLWPLSWGIQGLGSRQVFILTLGRVLSSSWTDAHSVQQNGGYFDDPTDRE